MLRSHSDRTSNPPLAESTIRSIHTPLPRHLLIHDSVHGKFPGTVEVGKVFQTVVDVTVSERRLVVEYFEKFIALKLESRLTGYFARPRPSGAREAHPNMALNNILLLRDL